MKDSHQQGSSWTFFPLRPADFSHNADTGLADQCLCDPAPAPPGDLHDRNQSADAGIHLIWNRYGTCRSGNLMSPDPGSHPYHESVNASHLIENPQSDPDPVENDYVLLPSVTLNSTYQPGAQQHPELSFLGV